MKLVLLTIILGFYFSADAMGCSCAEWDSPNQMLAEADAVYLAVPVNDSKLHSTIAVSPGNVILQTNKTRMRVVKKFKGKYRYRFDLFTEHTQDGANCGVNFQKNDGIYLIFAYKANGKYHTDSCSLGVVSPDDTIITEFISTFSRR